MFMVNCLLFIKWLEILVLLLWHILMSSKLEDVDDLNFHEVSSDSCMEWSSFCCV